MSFKKTAAIVAAAGALTAVAVPAMAFENEFHGMYKLKYFVSNYENGGSAFVLNPVAVAVEDRKTQNYFEQRARLQYIAKASDDLKLVTQFEIDSVFGDRAQGGTAAFPATRGSGGALEADSVNLETKHVYLDFKIPSTPVKVTAGIQPVKDAFKGVFLDADIAGINTVSKFGPATVGLGYFRAYDQSYFRTGATPRQERGLDNLDIIALSTQFAVNKDLNLGAAYYWYGDYRNPTGNVVGTTTLHVLGLTADAKIGKLGLSGFAAMQQGSTRGTDSSHYNGYAFNVAAKVPVGPGTLRTAALWTTGNNGDDNVNSAWQSVSTSQNQGGGTAANSYNDSNMMLLNRSTNMGGTATDQSMIYTTNNRDQGVMLATLGFDAKLTPKAYANANLGMAWASKTPTPGSGTRPVNQRTGNFNGTNYMGAELNIEAGYKMYDNLTASVQAAYVMLGGYYKDTVLNTSGAFKDPENPYTGRVVLSYAF